MSSTAARPFAVPEHQAPDLRPPILSARSLFKDYRDGSRTITVLRDLNLDLRPGEAVAVTGRSGSGKSTLLHLLGLLDRPTAGQIYFRHEEVSSLGEGARNRLRANSLGFVFQAYHLVAELNALQNVLLAARVAAGCGWGFGLGQKARARELLERVGLGHRMRHRPAKLSGGERQRVAIARALVNGPEVLLADEPTGNLDETTARDVENLIFQLADERRLAMVLVTHEPALAARCSRVLALEDGRLRDREEPAPTGG
ncbi:MAG: ABC transporter ATP-binding protein [Planctomycetota bacterium]|jgi:lipoprotein-releasing system ATP-binding protein